MHLVLVDSFSGWFELDLLPDMRSVTVIAKLKRHFAVYGIPQMLMTDYAQQFVYSEFTDFACAWDFKHIRSSPHYPQSNGLAERVVRSAKHLLEKGHREHSDIQAALLHLHNIPHAGLPSPAQLLLSRNTRTFLPELKDRMTPSVCRGIKAVLTRRSKESKAYYDRNAHTLPPLQQGQIIRMQTALGFDKLAVVQGPASRPNSYVVTSQGRQYTRNRRLLLHVQKPAPAEGAEDDYRPLPIAIPTHIIRTISLRRDTIKHNRTRYNQ
uniref:Integrase catalytic domain-containing protein n=1 Tax=Cyprinus carpio TaxID=7962 RepID=A0A8C2KPA7_CYPCA